MKATNPKLRFAHKIFNVGINAVITSHTIQKAPLDPNNQLNMSKEAGYEGKPKYFTARKQTKTNQNKPTTTKR